MSSQYLERYAEAETSAQWNLSRNYEHALVIPAYDESPDFLSRVLQHTRADVLAIVVVNAPDSAPTDALEGTRRLLEVAEPNTLVVDRVTRPLPKRQAVGLARKIGTDIAVQLIAEGRIENAWIYQTDADAILPTDYFTTALPASGASVFRHKHIGATPELQQAADLYDLHMALYVLGLEHASSPYAYPTLGSTIVVHADTYCAVRGYPKRNAGEDFYLLNKAAKVAGVTQLDPEITLEARASMRVPFGTGPALASILDAGLDQYQSYDWQSFELLRRALLDLEQWSQTSGATTGTIDEVSTELFAAVGFDKVREQLLQRYAPGPRRHKAVNEWFDALKTLRFVHEARRFHADQPLLETVATLPAQLQKRLPIPGWA